MTSLKTILFAENNPADAELAIEALAARNLTNAIEVVRDGVEALDYLYCRGRYAGRTGSLPVLLLLDLKMPRLGGIEVLSQIKSDPALQDIPVVVMTSSHEEQDFIRSQKLGTVAFIYKPVQFENLFDSLKQLEISCVPIPEKRVSP